MCIGAGSSLLDTAHRTHSLNATEYALDAGRRPLRSISSACWQAWRCRRSLASTPRSSKMRTRFAARRAGSSPGTSCSAATPGPAPGVPPPTRARGRGRRASAPLSACKTSCRRRPRRGQRRACQTSPSAQSGRRATSTATGTPPDRTRPFCTLGCPTFLKPASSLDALDAIVSVLHRRIENGEKLYIHCWGGRGRTGLVAAKPARCSCERCLASQL